MQIHELNNYRGPLESGTYLAVDDGMDTGKIAVPDLLVDVNEAVEVVSSAVASEAATRSEADAVLRKAIDDAAIVPAGSTVVVDSTLTIEGAAADAKATGNVKNDLKYVGSKIGVNLTNLITSISSGYYATSDGELIQNDNFSHADVDVTNIERVYIDGTLHRYTPAQFTQAGAFFDSNGDFIISIVGMNGGSVPTPPYEITVPENATKLGINTDYSASDYIGSVPDGLLCYGTAKNLKFIAGVIRNAGNGWEFINDSGHEPLNLANVSVNQSGQIVLDYGFTAKKVLSLIAASDETFANLYTIGGSVGLSQTILNVYTLPKIIGGRVLYNTESSAWDYSSYANFTGASFNTSTGVLTLSHETLINYPAREKFLVNANGYNCNAYVGIIGNDTIGILFPDIDGTIKKTPDNKMDAYVTRHMPKRYINANDIVDAGGNFWIFGVMEV